MPRAQAVLHPRGAGHLVDPSVLVAARALQLPVVQTLHHFRLLCPQGSLLRSGIHAVLAGRPNVGKSSLLNRLAGQERAIVTAQPGTTRDALREGSHIEGVPIVLVDTAGLRESASALTKSQPPKKRTTRREPVVA